MNHITSSFSRPRMKTGWQGMTTLAMSCSFILSACAPSPAAPAPAEAITEPPPTAAPTQIATLLPSPTATQVPTATATPAPTEAPTPTPTANPLGELSEVEYATLMNIAFSYFQDGLFEEERLLLTEMLSYSMTTEQMAQVYALRADDYKALGNYPAQIDDLLKAAEAGWEDPHTFNLLCWSYALTESPELALPHCEQAVQADPSPDHLDSRGVVYAMLGDQEAALEDFKVVVADLEAATSPDEKAIRAERQKWIKLLEAGQNPITPETLVKLRQETSPLAAQPTTAPAPAQEFTYSAVKEAMEGAGFTFSDMPAANGKQGAIGGRPPQGTCLETIGLGGSETSLDMAMLLMASPGCEQSYVSGQALWFISQFLSSPTELAEAILWMVNDVYYVIEGEQKATGEKRIGDATFKAEIVEQDQHFFQVLARWDQR